MIRTSVLFSIVGLTIIACLENLYHGDIIVISHDIDQSFALE